jgi:cob(I)alamin adenosyltransferase
MRDSVAETAMTVNLTRIYTKLGDGGETHLGDMSRVSKLHPRVEAYGTVDELNATIGVALLQPDLSAKFAAWLGRVQNDLLDLGADLSVPAAPEEDAGHDAGGGAGEGADAPPPKRERLRVGGAYVQWLEQACDEVNATLAPLRSFVIPGGTPAAAHLHVCRTVCRRAERRTIAVGAEVNPEVVRYLNRLSDLLFILSRAANVASSPEGEGKPGDEQDGDDHSTEPLWEPGAHGSDGNQGASGPDAS